MSNVQEALKAAEKLIVKAIMFESEAEQYLSESNYELNGCLGDSAADISVNGKAVLAKVRAALSEIEKCEPVAWIIDHVPNTGQRQLVSSKLYADNEMKKGEECNSGFGKRYPYDVCTPLYALPKDKD